MKISKGPPLLLGDLDAAYFGEPSLKYLAGVDLHLPDIWSPQHLKKLTVYVLLKCVRNDISGPELQQVLLHLNLAGVGEL